MRIVCISDTHGYHHDITDMPKGDLLIHAGDFTSGYRMPSNVDDFDIWYSEHLASIHSFNRWLADQPFPHKVVIAGNHDAQFAMFPGSAPYILSGCHYLENSSVTIEGLKIYGSPVTPKFDGWAFNRSRGTEIQKVWNKIPDDTDILVTHGPPVDILDMIEGTYRPLGDLSLRYRVEQIKPKLHVFGHIHTGHGCRNIGATQFVNASLVDEGQRLKFEPIVKEIEVNHAS